MPLVIVHNQDRTIKKLVMAANLSQLMEKALQKFGLPPLPDEYKLCLEGNGPQGGLDLDEEEAFTELSNQPGQQLCLILLPQSCTWTATVPQERPTNRTPETIDCGSGNSSDESHSGGSGNSNGSSTVPVTPQAQPTPPPLTIGPICKALDPVLDVMREESLPRNIREIKKRAVKEVVHHCGKFIEDNVPVYSRPICQSYVKAILSYGGGKYQPIFNVTVGGSVIDTGLESVTTSIYNLLNHKKYVKQRCLGIPAKKRRRLIVESNTEDADDVEPIGNEVQSSKFDDYGCVNYNPPLPPNETPADQEERRQMLLTMESEVLIKNLMVTTYPTQRVDIINCRPISKLRNVLIRWPHLKEPKYFFGHATALLGKDVVNVWVSELGAKASDIFKYMNTLCLTAPERRRSVPKQISELLALKASCDVLDEGDTNASAIFPLLFWHFREKQEVFLQVLKDGASNTDLLNAAKGANGNPIVVVSGHSIFDHSSRVTVVLLSDVVIETDSLLEGILYAFLSFYVFGFRYTPEVKATLEFIQRCFLLLNPNKGTKSNSKSRNPVCPKVAQLFESLQAFSSPWSLNSRQQQG